MRELRCQCKLRARSAIVRAGWPIRPHEHESMIRMIRRLTGAPADVAESAYNEALTEVAADIEQLDRIFQQDR